ACRVLVLILSKNANTSPFVQNEVNLAFSNYKAIATFRIEDVHPEGPLEFYCATSQWMDGYPDPLEDKADRLADYLQDVESPPRRGGQAFAQKIFSAGVLALLLLAVFLLDPLRIDQTQAPALNSWFQRLHWSDYPSGDDHLAAVLIDKPSLDEWKTDW